MDLIQRKDVIVFLLILILAFFIGYNGLYKYNLNKIDSLKADIEEEEKKNEILGIIGALDRKSQVYHERSFASTEITPLLDRISALAEEADIAIETFNPLPVRYTDEYVELLLAIPLRCQYHQLGRLLSLIETNQEFIWVKELNMEKSTVTDPKETRVPKIDLTISGLYLKK